MQITSAIVLYAIIWFLTLLVIAPINIKTQGDLDDVMPGTHAGSPEVHHLKKKLWITSGVALVIWAITVTIVVSGVITLRDFDWFNRLG